MNRKTGHPGLTAPRTLRSAFSCLEYDDDDLSRMLLHTTESWYEAKHPAQETDERNLINGLKPAECPFCHGTRFHKDGFNRNGIQRYVCVGCGRKFNPLTGTVFDSHKIPIAEWIEFLIHLFRMQSVRDSSIDNTNAGFTGRYWTLKVFEALKGYPDDILMSKVFYTDETYLPVKPSDIVRAGGKKLRGLSRNVHCVFTATDRTNTVLIADGFGKPSSRRVAEALGPHLVPGSTMVDDGERSHSVLLKSLVVRRITHPVRETAGLPNESNPMDPINEVHRNFKRFMRSHGGYDRSGIQDWCNLFSFIWNHHGDLPSTVRDMLQLLISTHDVVRYRSVMVKKADGKGIR